MSRTPEEVLKEIVSNQIWAIAQLTSDVEKLKEETQSYKKDVDKLTEDIQKMIGEIAVLTQERKDGE